MMVKMKARAIARTPTPVPLLLPIFAYLISYCRAEESSEQLYRRTVGSWRSNGSYRPWEEYTEELLARWHSSKPHQGRLELVGGFEEGILAIEQATVARGEGQNVQRDKALSQLYCAYGKVLLDLHAAECHRLALDPHTLLMGIETVSKDSEPSTYLCIENAENALRNSVTLDATNMLAGEFLATITGRESAHERKPKEFVAELFDSFADTFDEKLVRDLGYTVPQSVGGAAKALRSSYRSVLDAGCGTGLAGRHLKPLLAEGGVMIGVDASRKMLDVAAKCTARKGCGLDAAGQTSVYDDGREEAPLYDDLLVLDLEEMTLENTIVRKGGRGLPTGVAGFDLIVAADVLVYFGSLADLLRTFADLSTPGAGLIFSCERATEEEAPLGWRLLATGRFSHTKRHAVEAGREVGYELASYQQIVPRMERGEEVEGHLFTFVLKSKGRSEL